MQSKFLTAISFHANEASHNAMAAFWGDTGPHYEFLVSKVRRHIGELTRLLAEAEAANDPSPVNVAQTNAGDILQ